MFFNVFSSVCDKGGTGRQMKRMLWGRQGSRLSPVEHKKSSCEFDKNEHPIRSYTDLENLQHTRRLVGTSRKGQVTKQAGQAHVSSGA